LSAPSFLVVDFGTGGTKCILFGHDGNVLFNETQPVEFRFAPPAIDFDPKLVWEQVCGQVRRAVEVSEKNGATVVAVSSTSMREGNVFYDAEGHELLAVPNIDGRAGKEAEEIANRWGGLVYEKSGHWPMASFLVCRLRWLEANRPELHRKLEKVTMVNDWLLYRLSGVLASEPTNGCETAVFDLRSRDWSPEIIKELGVDRDVLPEVVECGTDLGQVTDRASRETGLPRSARVVVGAADTEAALLGCGALEEGRVVAVAGTTTPVQAVTASIRSDPEARTWSCCHVIPGRWTLESNAGATGMIFDWWARLTKEEYDTLTAEAASVPPGSMGVSSLVGAMVFNARKFPTIHGEMRGVMPWTGRGAISRAIIEGTCFAVRANYEQVEEVLGRKFGEMGFCGGAAESELWLRIQTDVLNARVRRGVGRHATAKGALALCRVAVGDVKSVGEAAPESGSVLSPESEAAAKYEEHYAAWRKAVIGS
jgi:autoinducer-2 kinase